MRFLSKRAASSRLRQLAIGMHYGHARPKRRSEVNQEINRIDRRNLIKRSATMLGALTLPHAVHGLQSPPAAPQANRVEQGARKGMTTITTKDEVEIYYKDWGTGEPVVFSTGWPRSADAWDAQMLYLSQRGYRTIAHDRRGHGRSAQTAARNDMNGYADDLAALIETLDLRDVVLVGHSTGGGEVARYIGRHGTKRVAKAVLV